RSNSFLPARRSTLWMYSILPVSQTVSSEWATAIIVAVWLFYLLLAKLHLFRHNCTLKIIMLYAFLILLLFGYFYTIYTSQLGPWMWKHNINPMGRTDAYDQVKFMYELTPAFVGRGMGYVADYLSSAGIVGFGLLHNDDLAMYIELGFWGFLVFLASYGVIFRVMLKRLRQREAVLVVCLILYTLVNYMTDNISIYISYMYPLYVMILALMHQGEKERNKEMVQV
ncbi:MAG: hypothetical protein PUC12_17635, partial [Clostridiales bacterium]|nr:hypothetical protein [Clostridiales bacterium]